MGMGKSEAFIFSGMNSCCCCSRIEEDIHQRVCVCVRIFSFLCDEFELIIQLFRALIE